jgi:hypothetical protein
LSGLQYHIFIEIDVEGLKEKCCWDHPRNHPLISFEFMAAFFAPAMRYLDMGVIQVGSTFNYACNIEWGYPS